MAISPDISIIIPHLNQNVALEKCINSLRQQTYPIGQMEVLIADNGSRQFPTLKNKSFHRLEVIAEPTPGPGPARNSAVKTSKGKYLFFIDADCMADPNWIMTGLSELETNPNMIFGGDVKIAKSESQQMKAIEAYENIFAYMQETYIKKKGFSGSGNLAVSKESFDRVGPFPGIEVAEDRGWGAMALRAGFKFKYCPDMIIYHPARETFQELFDKWARHSRHDYADLKNKPVPLLRWAFKAILVLASIPVHSFKIVYSKRLSGIMPKAKAIYALAVIRLFRVWFMLRMIVSKKFRNQDMDWNRK